MTAQLFFCFTVVGFPPPQIYVHNSVLQTSLHQCKHSVSSLQYPHVNHAKCNTKSSPSVNPYAYMCTSMTGYMIVTLS